VEPAEPIERRLLALVVVEDPAVRQVVRVHLEGLRIPGPQRRDVGFTVVEMETGRAALSMLAAVSPELVVVDLGLSALSGYEFCERLRATGSLQQVPLLAISARAMPQDRAAAEEAGVSAFLVKPFTPRQLTAQLVPLMTGSLAERWTASAG
jgi:two-component system chemotaxis response regulator CheY